MTTIAGGMESQSDEDCDIVFSSSVKPNDKGTPQTMSSISANRVLSPNNIPLNEMKSDKSETVPSPIVRRLRRNNNANIAYNRQRALKSKSLVFDDLRYAILQGNLDSTKHLYESNDIDVDTILKSGWTGLMYACSVGHSEIVDFLLQRHANPNYHQDMFTPLMSICISKKNEENLLKCCILLLKYNANVNVHERHHTTPLIFAAREGHTQIVRLLLEHEADPNASDYRGYTALAWAGYFGFGQVVRVLLEKGADRKKVNNMGQTPADIALDNGHEEVASLFQKVHFTEDEVAQKPPVTANGVSKLAPNSTLSRNFDSSRKYTKLGELDIFLLSIDGGQDLIDKFNEHHLNFHDLLIMDDADLEKIGIFQAGLRKRILEECKLVHKKDWQNSSLPNLRKNHYISCPDAVAMVANISKHLKYISTSVVYIRHQVQSQPRILEISRESANIHNLIDELEDSLKNLHTLKDEMRFLKMHLAKVQDKPEFSSSDRIVETNPIEKSNKVLITTLGLATISAIIASIWWKYPDVLDPPSILIRIPFLK